MMNSVFDIQFDPLLPEIWVIGLGILGIALSLIYFFKVQKSGALLRLVALGAFILMLLNPSLLEEKRTPVKDVVTVVVDESMSQSFGERTKRTEAALAYLQEQLGARENLELRVVHAPEAGALSDQTLLFGALEKSLSDVPESRRAGVIVLSDGQIHDVPQTLENSFEHFGPVHTLLTGDKNERDRQIVLTQAPSYGIVGQTVTIKYKIVDTPNIDVTYANVTSSQLPDQPFHVNVGQEITMSLPIEHAGQNVFTLSVADAGGEITLANNQAPIIINGVRDRLKVLLVSGMPYAGERTWRDLLKSDPGVDLVHFTILREPQKRDPTPQKEMALIAFPFRELFEVKLYDFDLIVFDRYHLNRIIPQNYFENIVRYVKAGGALLIASGPDFASRESLYETELKEVIPAAPTGKILRDPFLPTITENGQNHPVTKGLHWKNNADGRPGWGHWLRQIELQNNSGDVLMSGADDAPLLILDRVDEGRVAQLASDQIWLWSRGYDGGGPHAELLRRTMHWLMKEPELDERALKVDVHKHTITLSSLNYKGESTQLTMTKPDGSQEDLALEESPQGGASLSIEADQLGVYSFEDADGQLYYGIVGKLSPPELRSVVTTANVMTPLSEASKGGAIWLSDTPKPEIRSLSAARHYAGRHWIGLKRNYDYTVSGVQVKSLLPPWLSVLVLIGLMIGCWWHEGRKL